MVFIEKEVLELSTKEYGLLELFMENQGLTLPRDRILDRLWGWERGDVFDNTLSVTVRRLRERIAPYQGSIRTIRGIRYRMTGPRTSASWLPPHPLPIYTSIPAN